MPDVTEPHALGALIIARKRAEGWSDRDLEARTARAGKPMSSSNINKLTNHPVQELTLRAVQALAAALDVPEPRVMRAFVEALGFDIYELASPTVESAIASDEHLSQANKRVLLNLVQQMRDA